MDINLTGYSLVNLLLIKKKMELDLGADLSLEKVLEIFLYSNSHEYIQVSGYSKLLMVIFGDPRLGLNFEKDNVNREKYIELIDDVLASLDPKVATYIKLYVGIRGDSAFNYQKIADELQIPKEKIKENIQKGLRMLRHPSRSDVLRIFENELPEVRCKLIDKIKSQSSAPAMNAFEQAAAQLNSIERMVPVLIDQKQFFEVELEQGTKKWHQWRFDGVGGSDAPVICGQNPWKSIKTLFKEKISCEIKDFENARMRIGKNLEEKARNEYIKEYGVDVRPACIQHRYLDWLRASVDGISIENDHVIEIKCGKKAYEHVQNTGKVPDYYLGQLQHILAVTGFSHIHFWCYWEGEKPILLVVERDDDYIDRLLELEENFWTDVLAKRDDD